MVSMRSSKQIPPTAPPIIADRLEPSEPGVVDREGESVLVAIKQGGMHLQQSTYVWYMFLLDHGLI